MSITPVPISIFDVRAPIAESSGNGLAACRAKWCTRKYAPSTPSSSAATARSIDWCRKSAADRVSEGALADQWPKERKPIFFTQAGRLRGLVSFRTRTRSQRVGDEIEEPAQLVGGV